MKYKFTTLTKSKSFFLSALIFLASCKELEKIDSKSIKNEVRTRENDFSGFKRINFSYGENFLESLGISFDEKNEKLALLESESNTLAQMINTSSGLNYVLEKGKKYKLYIYSKAERKMSLLYEFIIFPSILNRQKRALYRRRPSDYNPIQRHMISSVGVVIPVSEPTFNDRLLFDISRMIMPSLAVGSILAGGQQAVKHGGSLEEAAPQMIESTAIAVAPIISRGTASAIRAVTSSAGRGILTSGSSPTVIKPQGRPVHDSPLRGASQPILDNPIPVSPRLQAPLRPLQAPIQPTRVGVVRSSTSSSRTTPQFQEPIRTIEPASNPGVRRIQTNRLQGMMEGEIVRPSSTSQLPLSASEEVIPGLIPTAMTQEEGEAIESLYFRAVSTEVPMEGASLESSILRGQDLERMLQEAKTKALEETIPTSITNEEVSIMSEGRLRVVGDSVIETNSLENLEHIEQEVMELKDATLVAEPAPEKVAISSKAINQADEAQRIATRLGTQEAISKAASVQQIALEAKEAADRAIMEARERSRELSENARQAAEITLIRKLNDTVYQIVNQIESIITRIKTTPYKNYSLDSIENVNKIIQEEKTALEEINSEISQVESSLAYIETNQNQDILKKNEAQITKINIATLRSKLKLAEEGLVDLELKLDKKKAALVDFLIQNETIEKEINDKVEQVATSSRKIFNSNLLTAELKMESFLTERRNVLQKLLENLYQEKLFFKDSELNLEPEVQNLKLKNYSAIKKVIKISTQAQEILIDKRIESLETQIEEARDSEVKKRLKRRREINYLYKEVLQEVESVILEVEETIYEIEIGNIKAPEAIQYMKGFICEFYLTTTESISTIRTLVTHISRGWASSVENLPRLKEYCPEKIKELKKLVQDLKIKLNYL